MAKQPDLFRPEIRGKFRRQVRPPDAGGGQAQMASGSVVASSGQSNGPDHGALLLGASGRRLPLCAMQDHLRGLSATLGFRVFPHFLRHSIAVHLLRRGADIRHIPHFLGHDDLETTKVYLRLVPGQLREDYDKAMPVFPVEPPPTAAVASASLP